MSRIVPIEVDPDFKPPERRTFVKPVHNVPRHSFSDDEDDFFESDFHRTNHERPRRRASAPSHRVFERKRSDFERVFDDDTEKLFRRRFEDDFPSERGFFEPKFHSRTRKTGAHAPGEATTRSFSVREEPLRNVRSRRLDRIDSDDFDEYVQGLLKDDNIDSEFSEMNREKRRDSGKEEVFARETGTRMKVGKPSWSGTGSVEIPVHFVQADDDFECAGSAGKGAELQDEETEADVFITEIPIDKEGTCKHETKNEQNENAKLTREESTQTEPKTESDVFITEIPIDKEDVYEHDTKNKQNGKQTREEPKRVSETEVKTDDKAKAEPEELTKIREIQETLEELQIDVDKFQESKQSTKSKEYLRLEELLTRCIMGLDTIEANGNGVIRCARRAAVTRVQDVLNELERKGGKSTDNNNVKIVNGS